MAATWARSGPPCFWSSSGTWWTSTRWARFGPFSARTIQPCPRTGAFCISLNTQPPPPLPSSSPLRSLPHVADIPGWNHNRLFLTLKFILGGMKELGKQCEGDYVAAARALLRSAQDATGDDDVCLVWRALAARGLGSNASKTYPKNGGEKRMFTASDMMPVGC